MPIEAIGAKTDVSAKTLTLSDFDIKDDGTDESDKFNAFFAAAESGGYAKVDWSGSGSIAKPLLKQGSATKEFTGKLSLKALGPVQEMLRLKDSNEIIYGGLKLLGKGGDTYSTRSAVDGLVFENSRGNTFTGSIEASVFLRDGISAITETAGGNGNCNENTVLGKIWLRACGSGNGVRALEGNWTRVSRDGSGGSTTQTETITVDVLPDYLTTDHFVVIDSHPYFVTAIDAANNQLTLFPHIATTTVEGAFSYILGSGIVLMGPNSGAWDMSIIDSLGCAVGYRDAALYGSNVGVMSAQANTVGQLVGRGAGSAHVLGSQGTSYIELNTFDIIQSTRAILSADLGISLADESKCLNISAPRYANDSFNPAHTGFKGISYRTTGGGFTREYSGDQSAGSSNPVEVAKAGGPARITYRDTQAITLENDPDLGRLFNAVKVSVTCMGSGAAGEPTGTITVTPEAGYTINGAANATFSGLTAPLKLEYVVIGTDWKRIV